MKTLLYFNKDSWDHIVSYYHQRNSDNPIDERTYRSLVSSLATAFEQAGSVWSININSKGSLDSDFCISTRSSIGRSFVIVGPIDYQKISTAMDVCEKALSKFDEDFLIVFDCGVYFGIDTRGTRFLFSPERYIEQIDLFNVPKDHLTENYDLDKLLPK